jgi:hypothetical protein
MDDLRNKLERLNILIKSLLGKDKPNMVPAIKMPQNSTASTKKINTKIPGIAPTSKKNPIKVAEQLKNPNPTKPNIEILKADKNGQWKIETI